MATAIFISYRRSDALQAAGRLSDDLRGVIPSAGIFRDVQAIDPGAKFHDALSTALSNCQVMLVMIGREWLAARDDAGAQRLADPEDWVRLEVGTALARGIRVIPVLLDGATLPRREELPNELQSLVERQAFEISDGRWKSDVERLAEALQQSYPDLRENADGDGRSASGSRQVNVSSINAMTRYVSTTFGTLIDIWTHPVSTYRAIFASPTAFERSLAFVTIMFFAATATYGLISSATALGIQAILFMSAGMFILWLAYAVFMHGFVYLFGGRKGVRNTIAAYLFTVGAVQPVLVVAFAIVLFLLPQSVGPREITGYGFSSMARVLVSGTLLDSSAATILRTANGVVIAAAFVPTIAAAHNLRMWRAAAAVGISLVFWIAVYALVYFAATLLELAPLVRLLEGT